MPNPTSPLMIDNIEMGMDLKSERPDSSPGRNDRDYVPGLSIVHIMLRIILLCLLLLLAIRWSIQRVSLRDFPIYQSSAVHQSTSSHVTSTTTFVNDIHISSTVASLANSVVGREHITIVTTSSNEQGRMAADSDTSSSDQAIITDSDGTWIPVTTEDSTGNDLGTDSLSSTSQDIGGTLAQPTETMTQTASITDNVIVSWKTVTATASAATSNSKSSASRSISKTTSSLSESTRSRISLSSPSHLTSILTLNTSPTPSLTPVFSASSGTTQFCPWSTCTVRPTVLISPLCQMVDPCWFDAKGPKSKPSIQGDGGMCACLCESGYCQKHAERKVNDVIGKGKLDCAAWGCCIRCGCLGEDIMTQRVGGGC